MTPAIPPESMRALLRPRSVAIIGATPGNGRGNWIHGQLLRYGFDGPIYPVNPRYHEIRGVRAYPSLLDIPEPVEFVAVALGVAQAIPAMQACVSKGVQAALFIAGGFAEAGAEGQVIQARLRELALAHGIAVCGPNCYGIANIHGHFAAYGGALVEPLRPGPIALLFQSGALTHAAMDSVATRTSGYSYVITTGNEAVVCLADYVNALADDDNTRVIACFVEGINNPDLFWQACRRARAAGKQLVVLKTGRSALAQRAALAHTAALSGPDQLYDTLFSQLGVVRVYDIDELIETTELLCHPPKAGGVALVSVSGGSCGLAADLAQQHGLQLAGLAPATLQRLSERLPPFATPGNPLDLTGAVGEQPELLPAAMAVLGDDPGVQTVALVLNTTCGGDQASRAFYHGMVKGFLAHPTPQQRLAFAVSSGPYDPEIIALLSHANLPLLMGMRESIMALGHWQRLANHQQWHAEAHAGLPLITARHYLAEHPGTLHERLALEFLQATGVPTVPTIAARTTEQAIQAAQQLGYPVVLKIDSPDLLHKTEVGGLVLNLTSADAVASAFDTLLQRLRAHQPEARIDGVLVQPMHAGGLETIIGVSNEPGIGPLVVFGLGGVLVEVLGDQAMRAAPFDLATANALIDATRVAPLLGPWRGRAALDRPALAAVLVRISQLAWQFRDQISAIDLNPVIVLPHGVMAVDGLVVGKNQVSQI